MTNDPDSSTAIVVGLKIDDTIISDQETEVEDVYYLILNVGESDGVSIGQKFIVFSNGPELFDPRTSESLGYFENVRGNGEVTHVQERMCTIRSTRTKREFRGGLFGIGNSSSINDAYVTVSAPFKIVKVGDLARRT